MCISGVSREWTKVNVHCTTELQTGYFPYTSLKCNFSYKYNTNKLYYNSHRDGKVLAVTHFEKKAWKQTHNYGRIRTIFYMTCFKLLLSTQNNKKTLFPKMACFFQIDPHPGYFGIRRTQTLKKMHKL